MKRKLFYALVLVASMMMPLAGEAAETEKTGAETEAGTEGTGSFEDIGTNPAVGAWYLIGKGGNTNHTLLEVGDYFIFPDGSIQYERGEDRLSSTLAEDGSFTIDLSAYEELAGVEIKGEVMPVSVEDMTAFGVDKDEYSYLESSEDSKQLIMTATYPDPDNPLSSEPLVSTYYFLRQTALNQGDFLERYMYGKTWTVGENTLQIDGEGKMDLNGGASTGSIRMDSPDEQGSLYIPCEVSFFWDKGGRLNYVPILVTADTLKLQNVDDQGDVLTLTLTADAAGQGQSVEEIAQASEAESQ